MTSLIESTPTVNSVNWTAPASKPDDIAKAVTFMARMQPYLLQGMSFEQAGEAVLMRDYELSAALKSNTEEGAALRHELATQTYSEIRKPDVYQRRAIITRKRRAESDKRLAAQFAQRRVEFLAHLDQVASAAKGGK